MRLSKIEVQELAMKTAKKVAPKFGLDPGRLARIATSIAWQESRFKPKAENNHSTARGLMQVLIGTQREVEKKYAKVPYARAKYKTKHFPEAPVGTPDKMFDPNYNMLIGMSYLAYQLKRYGDEKQAVHAYNQGSYPGLYPLDGKNYAASVMDHYYKNPIATTAGIGPTIEKTVGKITDLFSGDDSKVKFILNANHPFY